MHGRGRIPPVILEGQLYPYLLLSSHFPNPIPPLHPPFLTTPPLILPLFLLPIHFLRSLLLKSGQEVCMGSAVSFHRGSLGIRPPDGVFVIETAKNTS